MNSDINFTTHGSCEYTKSLSWWFQPLLRIFVFTCGHLWGSSGLYGWNKWGSMNISYKPECLSHDCSHHFLQKTTFFSLSSERNQYMDQNRDTDTPCYFEIYGCSFSAIVSWKYLNSIISAHIISWITSPRKNLRLSYTHRLIRIPPKNLRLSYNQTGFQSKLSATPKTWRD